MMSKLTAVLLKAWMHMAKKIPSGIVWRIFFSISALRVDVISDAIKPGATAFACKDKVTN